MAVRLVERHSTELQPQPAVIERPPQPSLRPVATEARPSLVASRHVRGVVLAITAVTALGLVAAYVTGRAPAVPFAEFPATRLALAAAIGIVVSAVHTRLRGNKTIAPSLTRAQILLCVAGALTMILIDNSVARAFGIAGAASIVRFRTPVEDPTDATVLFLLMALGMASGVGAFDVVLAGAAGMCLLLAVFGMLAPETKQRSVTIELVGAGRDFPAAHVHRVFARHGVAIEPAEWSQDTGTRVKYRASVHETLSLDALGADLMNRGDASLESVRWEIRKNA